MIVYACVCVYPLAPADARGSASRTTGFCLRNCNCNNNNNSNSNSNNNNNDHNDDNDDANNNNNNNNNNKNNDNNNTTLGSRRYVSEDTLLWGVKVSAYVERR